MTVAAKRARSALIRTSVQYTVVHTPSQFLAWRIKEGQAMLVLSRKMGQKFLVGGEIIVTVLEVQGSRVRLGIEAPAEVGVLRAELAAGSLHGSHPAGGGLVGRTDGR
jgi:carbon storage regulator